MTAEELKKLSNDELNLLIAEKSGWAWRRHVTSKGPIRFFSRTSPILIDSDMTEPIDSCEADGDPLDPYPEYSTDIAAAWPLVERMVKMLPTGDAVLLEIDQNKITVFCWHTSGSNDASGISNLAPRAISESFILCHQIYGKNPG